MFKSRRRTARDDPHYAEGMAHLQAGEWAGGDPLLSRRSTRAIPATIAAVRAALDQARFKARLDAATHVRAKRWTFRGARSSWRVLLVAAVLVLGVLVVQALDRQVVPAVRAAQLQSADRTAACRRDRPHLEAGSWTRRRPPSRRSRSWTPTTPRPRTG